MKIHFPLQKIIMFFVIILCLFGCEKVDVLKNYKQLQNSEQNTLTPLFADRINNVTSWLNNKKQISTVIPALLITF